MHYKTFQYFCILISFVFTISEKRSNTCFTRKIRNSECVCENLLSRDHPDPEVVSKLTCASGDAFQAAIEAKQSRNDLLFLYVQITSGVTAGIHHRQLKTFQAVEELILKDNRISFIEADCFKSQKNLKILDLSFNHLAGLEDFSFRHLFHLKNLTLSNNKLQSIGNNAFADLHNLLYLDLSQNHLSFLGNCFSLLKNLQYLSLSHNQISVISNNSFNNLIHLYKLDLSNNQLKTFPSLTFYRLKNLRLLSLAVNKLETLDENTFKGNGLLEKVNLTDNRWICDKRLQPLNNWLKKYEAYKEGAVCMEPSELSNYTIQHALEILYLEMKIHESPTCNASMCNCTISRDKLVVTVDCSNKGFVRLPEVVPYKTKALNLYNNKIKSLNTEHINATLWSDVSFLYLNNNIIDSVKSLEGNWLLKNLVALHLSNNRLTEIPNHMLEQIRGGLLDELYLSGNPWTCDCHTVRFQTWLQDNYRTVRNFDGICCSAGSGVYASLPIYKLKKSQLCPQQVQLVNYLDVLNGIMAVAIVVIIVKLSYDYWLQKRTGKLPRFFSLNL